MTDQSVIQTRDAAQVRSPKIHRHPTPLDIRYHITEALSKDADDPQTPAIPVHVHGLIRRAISDACIAHDRGESA